MTDGDTNLGGINRLQELHHFAILQLTSYLSTAAHQRFRQPRKDEVCQRAGAGPCSW